MQNFKFTEPYIYPALVEDGKDTKGNPINSKGEIINKWCIRYKIEFDKIPIHLNNQSPIQYRKEYGKSYNVKLNKIKNIADKKFEAMVLLGRIKDDLTKGIDPESREVQLENVTIQAIKDAEKYSFKYVFEGWFELKNYNNPIPSKVTSAKNLKSFLLKQFLPELTDEQAKNIRLITDEVISEYVMKKFNAGNWSAFTANNRIGWISGVFTYAYKKKLITTNPMVYVEKIKADKVIVAKDGSKSLKKKKEVRFNIYTDIELERLFKASHNTKDEAIFKTLHFAFIRFSEIFRLKIGHLDLANKQFLIPAEIAKGQRDGATASVPIFPELEEVLTRYLQNQFKGDLNPNYPLFPLDGNVAKEDIYNNFYTRYRTLIKTLRLDIKNPITITKTPYALKHTGAQLFIKQNQALNISSYVLIDAVMKMMRHVDFKTTQDYLAKDLGLALDVTAKFSFGKS